MTDDPTSPAESPEVRTGRGGVWPLAVGYIALRLLLTVALAAALIGISAIVGLEMPILVALMLGIVLQLPLSWLLLAPLREKVTAAMAAQAGERQRARAELRAALSGDEPGADG